MRQIKQPSELAAITKAVSATCHTLAEIKQNLSQFESEDELERAVSIGFLKQGLAEHAYQPIVATGKNATTLHYVKNNAPLESNDLVLLDVGAEHINYAADITRTWAFGKISARQKLVHRLVCELQDYAFAFLKSGVLMKDYENAMRAEAARICKKAGLIQNEDEINKIYPHATSHFLGLDVHDAADYNLPLAENMVLTVEPGIYLPSEGIGVRIEDDVVVTKKAVKIISNDLSRQL